MDVEQSPGPGRPEIGARVSVRLGAELLAAVDAAVTDLGINNRAALIRNAVAAYVTHTHKAAQTAVVEAYSRMDRYLARDDDDIDTDWVDPYSTLLDIEALLRPALPDPDDEYKPVAATEEMEDENDDEA